MDKKDHELVMVEKVEGQELVGVEDEKDQELVDVEDAELALEVVMVDDWLEVFEIELELNTEVVEVGEVVE